MALTAEQQRELEAFPGPLRALIEAELAAGNTVAEWGHGFPAPPVGAYVLLTRPVTTRNRAAGDGLDFYERQGSRYSGEFTDAKRYFFVLEPPHPAPPEPDMDAIRRGWEVQPEAAGRSADGEPAAGRSADPGAGAATPVATETHARPVQPARPGRGARLPRGAVVQSSTPTGASWLLHFRDRRPPHEVVHQLERTLMSPFELSGESGRLVGRAKSRVTGATYAFELVFEAAEEAGNAYSLKVEGAWPGQSEASSEYHRRTSGSWFESWTREFERSRPAAPGSGSPDRYEALSRAALDAERELDSVEAIQGLVVAAMKEGASFSTSHKEGGTTLAWQHGRFTRSDYGESTDHERFPDEGAFLGYLRRFFDSDIARGFHPDPVPERVAWRLIWRRLRR